MGEVGHDVTAFSDVPLSQFTQPERSLHGQKILQPVLIQVAMEKKGQVGTKVLIRKFGASISLRHNLTLSSRQQTHTSRISVG